MNVCIPTLNSIDTFWECVESIRLSTIKCNIYVIDNGGLVKKDDRMVVFTPATNLGVAASWNWFIDNVPEPRVITNDDIVFYRGALEIIRETATNSQDLVAPENLGSPFSCFLLSNSVVNKVGKFDEWISPRYAYFEDNDYSYRMSLANVGILKAQEAFVKHVGSSTLKGMNRQKKEDHHNKFRLARDHYVKKWGGEPGKERFSTPFGKR